MSDLFCSNALPADYESAPTSVAAEGVTAGTGDEDLDERQGELQNAAQQSRIDRMKAQLRRRQLRNRRQLGLLTKSEEDESR